MKKYFVISLLLGIQWAYSQSIDSLKLKAYFESLDLNEKFMGSVALCKEGKIIYRHHIGFSDLQTKKKHNGSSKYRIGSISKTFTATLVFKAIEEGKLTLSETINKYFPNLKNSTKITIEHLLRHRSGIPDFIRKNEYFSYSKTPKTEHEMRSKIEKYGSDFEPNSKAKYSNSNYLLLSYILQKIYSTTFGDILNEKIVEKVGLKNTYFGGSIDVLKNEANSYWYSQKWVKQIETDASVPMGAACVVASPEDLLLFADALFNYKILTEASVTQMKTLKNKYGMGLFKTPFKDTFSFGHGGKIDGFKTLLRYFPEENYGLAITANGINYDIKKISVVLLNALFHHPFEIPTFTSFTLRSKDLKKYVGVYSGADFPLKIAITKSNNFLMAKPSGQFAFRLTAIKKDEFEFKQAGVVLTFKPEENLLFLKQNGKVYLLNK